MSDLFRDRQRTLFSREPTDSDATPMNSADLIQGATLIGAMLAYPMYGTLICQVSSYYKRFPDDLRHLKVLVALILLTSTVGLVINVNLIWYYCIQRGIGVDPHIFRFCDHWTISAFFIPNEITCFLAEALFLKRMWALSRKRYPTILAFVPFMLGWVFTIVYIQGMFRHWCYPELQLNQVVLSSFPFLPILQLTPPLPLAALPLHMLWLPFPLRWLHRRNDVHPPLPANVRHANRDQEQTEFREDCEFVGGLDAFYWIDYVLCILIWVDVRVSAVAFVLTYILLPDTYIALAIYLVRGNIYANAVLALLHVRTRYRRVADEVISLHVQVQTVNGARAGNGGDSDGLTRRSRS
ncbi:uncharacterized protein LACBIDRAFT_318130 [Laccaria bicolor S238N-H82]|uniref:Predicted protein n=1 Tax=Laccaria bicolor (strain S238N-H82 / ATCC MYA-4686) TaxID=486041 RepID=B0D624_LACBS|nr:uncharacterized protein LACBIDRAFT_318130 [Laccaria bicolor S238N-H82]EDR10124.1 predicted protein [Laccaria bicolor S238N-H82]|eukprot:XP_001879509.1 predicted protein [Laccaria bicolor S238N-H82]